MKPGQLKTPKANKQVGVKPLMLPKAVTSQHKSRVKGKVNFNTKKGSKQK